MTPLLTLSKISPSLVSSISNTILTTAGPAFFLTLQASSINTALKINDSKSTGKLSPIPFVSLLTNCIIWTLYGYLKNDKTVLIPNAIGIITGAIGTLIFQKYSLKTPMKIYGVSAIINAAAIYLAANGNWQLLGSIGCLLAVSVSGSPLATVKTVIDDKSTAALPFSTSLATWFNCFSWSLYGLILAHDVMIYGPNLLGLALATIQMAMFVVYGMPPKLTKKLF